MRVTRLILLAGITRAYRIQGGFKTWQNANYLEQLSQNGRKLISSFGKVIANRHKI